MGKHGRRRHEMKCLTDLVYGALWSFSVTPAVPFDKKQLYELLRMLRTRLFFFERAKKLLARADYGSRARGKPSASPPTRRWTEREFA